MAKGDFGGGMQQPGLPPFHNVSWMFNGGGVPFNVRQHPIAPRSMGMRNPGQPTKMGQPQMKQSPGLQPRQPQPNFGGGGMRSPGVPTQSYRGNPTRPSNPTRHTVGPSFSLSRGGRGIGTYGKG